MERLKSIDLFYKDLIAAKKILIAPAIEPLIN